VDQALAVRALAWLAQREYSRRELRQKLLRNVLQARGATTGANGFEAAGAEPTRADPYEIDTAPRDHGAAAERVDAVLDWLEDQRHLSPERFVESRVHLRAGRYGNVRIRQELAQHGVSIPPQLGEALRASEFERARAVWQRKFGAQPPGNTPDATARQTRFLAGRGFSGDVIRRVLREVDAASHDAPGLSGQAAATIATDLSQGEPERRELADARRARLRVIRGGAGARGTGGT
jgi:regulatory protein